MTLPLTSKNETSFVLIEMIPEDITTLQKLESVAVVDFLTSVLTWTCGKDRAIKCPPQVLCIFIKYLQMPMFAKMSIRSM